MSSKQVGRFWASIGDGLSPNVLLRDGNDAFTFQSEDATDLAYLAKWIEREIEQRKPWQPQS